MFWRIESILDTLEKRKSLRNCERCKVLYKKLLAECPHCTGINDDDLYLLLVKRSSERVNIGKRLLYAMVIIIFLITLITELL